MIAASVDRLSYATSTTTAARSSANYGTTPPASASGAICGR